LSEYRSDLYQSNMSKLNFFMGVVRSEAILW
jgi:hypothetical protein